MRCDTPFTLGCVRVSFLPSEWVYRLVTLLDLHPFTCAASVCCTQKSFSSVTVVKATSNCAQHWHDIDYGCGKRSSGTGKGHQLESCRHFKFQHESSNAAGTSSCNSSSLGCACAEPVCRPVSFSVAASQISLRSSVSVTFQSKLLLNTQRRTPGGVPSP